MKRDSESTAKNRTSASLEFAISRFHLGRHIFALILAAGLCLSLVMSELTYHMDPHAHHNTHLSQMIVPYLLMLFFVSIIAVTTILTARKIKMSEEGIEISTLLWQEKLAWADLQAFKSPPNLKIAWLKTKRVPYLLAKSEFKQWVELEKTLQKYIANH